MEKNEVKTGGTELEVTGIFWGRTGTVTPVTSRMRNMGRHKNIEQLRDEANLDTSYSCVDYSYHVVS